MKIRRRTARKQQRDDVQRALLVVAHQVRAFRRIQVGSNVLEASRPNGWVEEKQRSGTGIVGEEENVALDEDLKVLEFVELEHPKLEDQQLD